MITPFNGSEQVDFPALEKVIDFVINGGVDYVITLGTTGEAPTLSTAEKVDIINFTYEKVGGRVPVVVGIGGNDTAGLLKDLSSFPLDQAVAVLSASPYYNKPSQEGIFQHYKLLAKESPKPILLYNVPGRTSRNMTAATTLRLAKEVENIAGTKEASGDMLQCMEILRDRPKDFLVVSGDDALALPQIACGMDGVISVIANAFPREFAAMVNTCLKDNFTAAKELNDPLLEIYDILFAENNPAGVKAFMAKDGLIENVLRLPLVPLSRAVQERVDRFAVKPNKSRLQVQDL